MTDTIASAELRLTEGSTAYYDSLFDASAQAIAKTDTTSPALLLLHGYCGSSAYWDQVIPLILSGIAKAGRPVPRVLAPDLPGHGRSEGLPESVYTMECLAAHVQELVTKLDVSSMVVMGHSLGGYISLAFAESQQETEEHSGLLVGFGIIHSTPLPDSEEAKGNRDKAIALMQEKGASAFIAGLAPKLFAPATAEQKPELIARAQRIGEGTDTEAAMATARGMKARVDRREVIQRSDLPVLLLAGEKDQLISSEHTFAAAAVNSTQTVIPNAGHMGMWEEPELLAQAIADFYVRSL